ncbi:hypothetical protein [Enterocloster lavalensis]|uniref:hypothetical protein n=1 Tax=Enterocloster lavalensis TaxID=460384 RepID=UPI001D091409|nr:hypothetical protein [Enterocloster lavalensis]MCB6343656.1 hypothetical protein [Enterocloster lavalensis]
MADLPKIRIEVKNGFGTQVFVNDKEVEGIREIRFKKTGGELPVLEMEFMACDVEINGQWLPRLPKMFEELYESKVPEAIKKIWDEGNG